MSKNQPLFTDKLFSKEKAPDKTNFFEKRVADYAKPAAPITLKIEKKATTGDDDFSRYVDCVVHGVCI